MNDEDKSKEQLIRELGEIRQRNSALEMDLIELKESEERFRTVVTTAGDALWTLDLGLNYTFVSPSITGVLGYSVDEIMSMNPLDILTKSSAEMVTNMLQQELQREAAEPGSKPVIRLEEIDQYHKIGSIRDFEI